MILKHGLSHLQYTNHRLTIGLNRCLPLWAVLLGALFLGGCDSEPEPLKLADLNEPELNYIQRLIILERAKAVAFNDRTLGDMVLDSLAIAWGDSAEAETASWAPLDPDRSQAVHELLGRILEADQDSLREAPFRRRIFDPLVDPVAMEEPVAAIDSTRSGE